MEHELSENEYKSALEMKLFLGTLTDEELKYLLDELKNSKKEVGENGRQERQKTLADGR